jgi:phosphatidate phosphatase APP1
MSGWKKVIAETVSNVEDQFDLLKYRLRERLGGRNPIIILPYRGYGRADQLYLKGRVLEEQGIAAADDNDILWDNLVNTYKRFKSNEIPQARLAVRFQGFEQVVETDQEGYFEVRIKPADPFPMGGQWISLELELLHPQREGSPPVKAEARILLPSGAAQFGIISDIDDTVVKTNASDLLSMARMVFLGNARTRLPFPGVGAFYRALSSGSRGKNVNPLFFVSSSPWNMYDLFEQFFQLENIPPGPLILRDWGISEDEFLPTSHTAFKTQAIQGLLDFYKDLSFILIGDSGQQDPEIYAEIIKKFPGRILTAYIRDVSPDLARDVEIQQLAQEILQAGSTMVLADNTLLMAEHALDQGWITQAALAEIQLEKELDEAPPNPLERLLGEQDEAAEPGLVIPSGKDNSVSNPPA